MWPVKLVLDNGSTLPIVSIYNKKIMAVESAVDLERRVIVTSVIEVAGLPAGVARYIADFAKTPMVSGTKSTDFWPADLLRDPSYILYDGIRLETPGDSRRVL